MEQPPLWKRRKVSIEIDTVLSELFRQVAQDVDLWSHLTVRKAYNSLRNKNYRSFIDLADSWTSQMYGSSGEHFAWNQLACLLKKYPFDDALLNPERVAREKFMRAEHRCLRQNQRLRARRRRLGLLPYEGFFHEARRWISSVIGEEPNMDRIWDMCDFGPGASLGVHGDSTHTAMKMTSEWTCTPSCLPFALAALSVNTQVWEHLFARVPYCLDYASFTAAAVEKIRLVQANKIIFVPKTAKTHRSIAVEPLLNGYVQKGVDQYLRGKLRRVGLDLSNQATNQFFAFAGSADWEGSNPLSTLDLASASDTISIEIVRELLPSSWFSLLTNIRSPSYVLDGADNVRYDKFSSMGNGFSFPLETLIFASLVHSVYKVTGDTVFRVYGDDIVVQQSSALLVIEVLRYAGFQLNVEKSFVFGPFRESCGADFYGGLNVRPYYVDEVPREWDDIYKWHNGLAAKLGNYAGVLLYLRSLVPREFLFVKEDDSEQDDAFRVESDVFLSSPHVKYLPAQSRFQSRRWMRVPVLDRRSYSTGCQMYGLLRGQSSFDYHVAFARRRKTTTHLRFV